MQGKKEGRYQAKRVDRPSFLDCRHQTTDLRAGGRKIILYTGKGAPLNTKKEGTLPRIRKRYKIRKQSRKREKDFWLTA